MKALLDTHTFLWWNSDAPELSAATKSFIEDGANEIFLSAASAWEIAIKAAKGRLKLPETPDKYVLSRLLHYHFSPLPIQFQHVLHTYYLPVLHQDPFDRLLVAQSQMENMPILTTDGEIKQYEVEVIW